MRTRARNVFGLPGATSGGPPAASTGAFNTRLGLCLVFLVVFLVVAMRREGYVPIR
jgi:hypothetical protein